MRVLKNYRLPEDIIEKLEDLQKESGRTATELIESLIQFGHEELTAAKAGEPHDEVFVAQLIGKRVRRLKVV